MITEKQRKEREKGIGGSDFAALIGLDPYKTNQDVWNSKVFGTKNKVTNQEKCDYGSIAEKYLISLFSLDFPEFEIDIKNTSFKHPKHDFLLGNLDAVLTTKKTTEIKGVLEIKTATINNPAQMEKWKKGMPTNYLCQCIWYLMITGFDFAILKAQLKHIVSENDFWLETRHYRVNKTDVLSSVDFAKETGIEFWNDYVLTKMKPLVLPAI